MVGGEFGAGQCEEAAAPVLKAKLAISTPGELDYR